MNVFIGDPALTRRRLDQHTGQWRLWPEAARRDVLRDDRFFQFLRYAASGPKCTPTIQELWETQREMHAGPGHGGVEAAHSKDIDVAQDEAFLETRARIAKLRRMIFPQVLAGFWRRQRDYFANALLSHLVLWEEPFAASLAAILRSNPEKFPEAARRHSQDTATRTNGGKLGWMRRYLLTSAGGDAVFKASPGEVVGPIGVHGDYVLYFIHERTDAPLAPEEVEGIEELAWERWLRSKLSTPAQLILSPPALRTHSMEL